MTTPLDRDLAERLERLAAAVPVRAGELDPVHRSAVVARQRVRMSWLTPLVALVVLVLIAGVVGVGSLNILNRPVSVTTKLGEFTLTLTSAKARYRTGEAVELRASLTFGGAAELVQIAHAGHGPLAFGIEEPVQGYSLSPIWRSSCAQRQLHRGVPDERPFTKSGGYDGPDQAGFVRFMQDPTLTLSAGTWHAYVVAQFSLGDCDGEQISMRAELAIEVEDQPGPSRAAPTPIPESGAIHIVNLDPRTVEVVFRNRLVALLACGETAVIAAAKLDSSSPWHFIVRDVEDKTIGAATLDWHLPAGILIREGTVLGGSWPMSYGPAFDACSPDTASSPGPTPAPTSPPPDRSPIKLETMGRPIGGGIDLCPQALAQGTLIRNPRTGMGFTSGLGDVTDVVWPAGYTAWIEGGVAVLRDARGVLVAREGDLVTSGGGFMTDGRWYACSGVEVGSGPDTP